MSEAVSPDGAWKAAEYEEFCEGPFLTHIGAGIRRTFMRDAARSAHILSVSANGADEDLDIAWTAPRTLQAIVHSSLAVNVLTCEFERVRIEIRFPPDEAARRAAWHRQ